MKERARLIGEFDGRYLDAVARQRTRGPEPDVGADGLVTPGYSGSAIACSMPRASSSFSASVRLRSRTRR